MQEHKDMIPLYQQFVRLQEERAKMNLRGWLEASLDYAQYCIRSEFDKGSKQSIKYKKRKQEFTEQYLLAYNEQNNVQRLESYIRVVRFIRDVKSENYVYERLHGDLQTSESYTRSYNLKIWKRKTMKIDRENNHIFCSKHDKVKIYNLDDYLIRESKNKDFYCFVLEAINEKPHIKSRQVHIGFKDIKLYNQWFASVREGIFECEKTRILKELGIEPYQFLGIANRSIIIENDQKLKHANSIASQSSGVTKSDILIGNILDEMNIKDEREITVYHKSQSYDPQSKRHKEQSKELPVGKIPSTISIQSQKELKPIQTITQQLLDSDGEHQTIEQIQDHEDQQVHLQSSKKRNLNLFHQILPEFELNSLTDQTGFQLIESLEDMRLFRSNNQPQRYKFFMTLKNVDMERVFDPIVHINTYLKWNAAIEEVSIKNLIRSENTAIIYQKHKAYSKIYRPRDFVYLRHVFKKDNNMYVVDKSLDNANYPPFMTIVRGDITTVWGILNSKDHITVAADIQIKNQGYLNEGQDHNLSMMYLRGLFHIQSYVMQKGLRKNETVQRMFDLDWDIAKNQQNVIVEVIRQKRITIQTEKDKHQQFIKNNRKDPEGSPSKFSKKKINEEIKTSNPSLTQSSRKGSQRKERVEPILEQPKLFEQDSIVDKLREESRNQQIKIIAKPEEDKGEIEFLSSAPLQTDLEIKYNFTSDGLVVVPQEYIAHRFLLEPQPPSPMILQEAVDGHPIWKGEWIFDKSGGIIFTNQKKIEEQKGVLKFILTKIGKNILSGKSILNISLPVDIFAAESNLQRLSFAMTYAPIYLERAAKDHDPVKRFKPCIAFGITNSVLYLNMQKPFNPILGETFQGWINGCPVYMEQVSHHPPIASFLFLGRGYKISGSLESKVELHMNSGCGTTDGVYKIEFDDGSDICFITPGGEISGLTYGDRKFNLIGKCNICIKAAYYWSVKHCLFVQLVFDPDKKGFFSVGKKQTTSDYFEGTLLKVTPEFLDSFIKNKKKRPKPEQKDIIDQMYKISGIWCKELMAEGQKILDLNRDFGCKLEYDKFQLASDGNWREDIAYRRKQDISRAQNQKERLEVLQRKDRKLRETKHGKKH